MTIKIFKQHKNVDFIIKNIKNIIKLLLVLIFVYIFISLLSFVNPLCLKCLSTKHTHAGCAIFTNDKILLVKDKASNKYGFPGGTFEHHESPNHTAFRETTEETGYIVYISNYIKYFVNENFTLFKCNIVYNTKHHDDEILDFKYSSKQDILQLIQNQQARFPNQLQYIYDNFDKLK